MRRVVTTCHDRGAPCFRRGPLLERAPRDIAPLPPHSAWLQAAGPPSGRPIPACRFRRIHEHGSVPEREQLFDWRAEALGGATLIKRFVDRNRAEPHKLGDCVAIGATTSSRRAGWNPWNASMCTCTSLPSSPGCGGHEAAREALSRCHPAPVSDHCRQSTVRSEARTCIASPGKVGHDSSWHVAVVPVLPGRPAAGMLVGVRVCAQPQQRSPSSAWTVSLQRMNRPASPHRASATADEPRPQAPRRPGRRGASARKAQRLLQLGPGCGGSCVLQDDGVCHQQGRLSGWQQHPGLEIHSG
jgi:hypothetical protein